MKYIVFDDAGAIHSRGECPDAGASFEHFAPLHVMEVADLPDDLRNWVVESGQLMQKLNRPSEYHFWDVGSAQWVADQAMIKAARKRLLAATDWTQLHDVPATTRAAWVQYRQALRDITAQPGFPNVVIWPAAPAETKVMP